MTIGNGKLANDLGKIDPAVASQWAEQWRPFILRICLYFLPDAAEDMTHEVMLKILFCHFAASGDKVNQEAWVSCVTSHACIDSLRRSVTKFGARFQSLADGIDLADQRADPVREVNDIDECIASLPPRLRCVAELLLANPDRLWVAARLGISKRELSRRTTQIRARLKSTRRRTRLIQ